MPLPRPAPGTGKWWAIGITGCLLATIAIIWVNVVESRDAVRPTVTAYKVLDEQTTRVDYDLLRPEGTRVRCVVSALDARHGRVGTKEDLVAASGERWAHRSVTVRTSARAVTGVVESCVRVGRD